LQLLHPSSSNPAGSSTFFGAGSKDADLQVINFQISPTKDFFPKIGKGSEEQAHHA
jgi:hypothetical protein